MPKNHRVFTRIFLLNVKLSSDDLLVVPHLFFAFFIANNRTIHEIPISASHSLKIEKIRIRFMSNIHGGKQVAGGTQVLVLQTEELSCINL